MTEADNHVSYPFTRLQGYKSHSHFYIQGSSNDSYKTRVSFGKNSAFGSNCQEIRNDLHVPFPLLPMGQVRRFGELDPLDLLKLIEEGM